MDNELTDEIKHVLWELENLAGVAPTLVHRYLALQRELDGMDGSCALSGQLNVMLIERFEAIAMPTVDELTTAAIKSGQRLKTQTE